MNGEKYQQQAAIAPCRETVSKKSGSAGYVKRMVAV